MKANRRPPNIRTSILLHLVLSYFGAILISPLIMLLTFKAFSELDLPYLLHIGSSCVIGIAVGMLWFIAFDAQALFNYRKHEKAANAGNDLFAYYEKHRREEPME